MKGIRGCAMVAALGVAAVTAVCSAQPADCKTPADLARIAGWKGAAVNSPDAFRFVVMGDRTGEHVPGVWPKAVADINRLRPDFVMCIGDLVEGFEKDRAAAAAEWAEMDAMIRKLKAPFFYCPGNHDVPNALYRSLWARRDGVQLKLWYSFNYRRCHFVIFDSTAMEREIRGIAEEQWAWLAKDLAAAGGAKHIFVFSHHPVFGDKGDWMRLRKMLHAGKTTVFCGHVHALSYAVEHGIPVVMIGPTGGFSGEGDWRKGRSHQFAHVTVSDGVGHVSILPVGHVLPHDLHSERSAAARRRALVWGAEFTPVTRAGGEVVMDLPNASDVAATYRLTWKGPAGWFGGKAPGPETLKLPAGKSVRRTYRLSPEPDAVAPPPAMELAYEFTLDGKVVRGRDVAEVFVRPVLTAKAVRGIRVDGRLGDWPKTPGRAMGARWQVRDNPTEWTAPADCSAVVRIGYDAATLYVAVDVTDDVLLTAEGAAWQIDGVEVFWDGRDTRLRGGPYGDGCGSAAIPLSAADAKAKPVAGGKASPVRTACRRRAGGYVAEPRWRSRWRRSAGGSSPPAARRCGWTSCSTTRTPPTKRPRPRACRCPGTPSATTERGGTRT